MRNKECSGIPCGSREGFEARMKVVRMSQAGELQTRKAKYLGIRKYRWFRMKRNAPTAWERHAIWDAHVVTMNGGPLFRGKHE